jgi:hypothetical protein
MRRHRRHRFYLAWLAIMVADGAVIIAVGYGLTALAVHFWAAPAP